MSMSVLIAIEGPIIVFVCRGVCVHVCLGTSHGNSNKTNSQLIVQSIFLWQ